MDLYNVTVNFFHKVVVNCLSSTFKVYNRHLICLNHLLYRSHNNYNNFWHNNHTLVHHKYFEAHLVKNTFECSSNFLIKNCLDVTFDSSYTHCSIVSIKCFLLPSEEKHFVKRESNLVVSLYNDHFNLSLKCFLCNSSVLVEEV